MHDEVVLEAATGADANGRYPLGYIRVILGLYYWVSPQYNPSMPTGGILGVYWGYTQ